ncbi:MAG: adenylate/guanylate cyclase domain-containing protein [Desulfobaccales bacterium]
MSIRTYLTLSYLGLIILLTGGMWVMGDRLSDRVAAQNLATAQKGSQKTIAANYQISEDLLTLYGQKIVELKVEGVVKGLALRLKNRDIHDYASLREDNELRKTATQGIDTPEGVVGFLMVSDEKGEVVFHPNRDVEGKNSLTWQQEYPEVREMVRRSLTEEKVSGYYTFKDRDGREKKRYCARVHVPGTPLIAVANVNIEDFFLPAQAKIKQAGDKIALESKERIKKSSQNLGRQIQTYALFGGLVLALVGTVSGLGLASVISRPILRLRDGVRQVGQGDFSVAVPEKGLREVAHLAQSFNNLGKQLIEYMEKRDFIRDTFGRYVTQEVVKKLLEDKTALELGGETREVSIVMSDLRGFTALIADMQPEQVITFLNRYLGKMIEILTDHRAVIDEIVGDGILAFFGAPEPMADHPARAVACALKMQTAMAEINAMNASDGLPHLEMGIAVNTGTVVVGNIGSELRAKYSVVGAHVNFTSRIEAFAVGGQVLISPATYERVRDSIQVRQVIKGEMKGVPGTATIYEVAGIGEPYDISLPDEIQSITRLAEPLQIRVNIMEDKIVVASIEKARITHLSKVAAQIAVEGDLKEWQDVSLHLLDEKLMEKPGKIYGKVTRVKAGDDRQLEAEIRFTSVSQEIYRIIRQVLDEA